MLIPVGAVLTESLSRQFSIEPGPCSNICLRPQVQSVGCAPYSACFELQTAGVPGTEPRPLVEPIHWGGFLPVGVQSVFRASSEVHIFLHVKKDPLKSNKIDSNRLMGI